MILQAVFGIIILVILIFTSIKIIGSLFKGLLLIGLTLLASYLIFGSLPSLSSIPFSGSFNKLKIVGVSRDTNNSLLVAVNNVGFSETKISKVLVNNQEVQIINGIEKIDPHKTDILQVNWNQDFNTIEIQSSVGKATYKK